jgi:hypothetical protein
MTSKEPRLYDASGKPMKLDLKADAVTVAAAGTRVVVPAEGDRATVLEAAGAPAGSSWRFMQSKGSWLAILKLPESKVEQRLAFSVKLWALPKDDEGLLKDLFAK